jgi:hypothetical protein
MITVTLVKRITRKQYFLTPQKNYEFVFLKALPVTKRRKWKEKDNQPNYSELQ